MTTEHNNSSETKDTAAPLLSVKGLCKYFPIHGKGVMKRKIGDVKAVDDVSFDLQFGETLGLVGESGCGKTTVARTILRALPPTAGEVLFHPGGSSVDLAKLSPKELKPWRTQMQMIFQDPFASLNPRMTVRDIIGEPLIIHDIAKGDKLDERVSEMLRMVGLKPEHRTRFPHAFSGGQRQRIGIAAALIMNPSLVVCDEAVSALDVSVQAQVINLLQDMQKEFNLTYIFIAHDLSVVKHITDRIGVMYAGRIVELATTRQLFDNPMHPYSKALLSAVPNPDPEQPVKPKLFGEVADPGNLPPGCAFSPRCEDVCDICREKRPPLVKMNDGRLLACHHYSPQGS